MILRFQLIKAIDDFVEQSTILPPGEWDTTIRLNPPQKIPSRVREFKSNK